MNAAEAVGGTIVAVATAPGASGVGVLRLSGPSAVAAVDALFVPVGGGPSLASAPPRRLGLGRLHRDGGGFLDEVLAVRFPAPHSFTGEDVVEVHAHGGSFHLAGIQSALLESARRRGMDLRPAGPGEFTRRAFLNGKLDLTRAEAVADLIHADSELAREAAALQLAGGLGSAVGALRGSVVALLAEAEAACDFPEEEGQLPSPESFRRRLGGCVASLEGLLSTARFGRAASRGVRVALCGAPNSGKSSLLNALCGEERAIVAASPGTTRDWLEARVEFEGLAVGLCDTAGLRPAAEADEVEREGARRALDLARAADAVVVVLDRSRPLPLGALRALGPLPREVLFVANKADLVGAWDASGLAGTLATEWGDPWAGAVAAGYLEASARTGQGVAEVRARLVSVCLGEKGRAWSGEVLLTSARHEAAAREALEALRGALEAFGSGAPPELLAVDLRAGLDALGSLVGSTTRAEVVEEIFKRFCIGK